MQILLEKILPYSYWFEFSSLQVLMLSILLLLMSNAVSIRRDKSILFARSSLNILLCCFFLTIDAFDLKLHEKGIGLFSGLFQTTSISIGFHIFVFIIPFVTLQLVELARLYPRKVWKEQFNSFFKLFFNKIIYYNSFILNNSFIHYSFILNKMWEQYRIIEYLLIIIFVLIGEVFLMSTGDFMSIFLSLELQSYALYILCVVAPALYRDPVRVTTGGLTWRHFLCRLTGLGAIGCFILLAFGLLYGNYGNTGFDGLYIISNISNASVTENFFKAFGAWEWLSLDTIYPFSLLKKPCHSLIIMSNGLWWLVFSAKFTAVLLCTNLFWPVVYDVIYPRFSSFILIFARLFVLWLYYFCKSANHLWYIIRYAILTRDYIPLMLITYIFIRVALIAVEVFFNFALNITPGDGGNNNGAGQSNWPQQNNSSGQSSGFGGGPGKGPGKGPGGGPGGVPGGGPSGGPGGGNRLPSIHEAINQQKREDADRDARELAARQYPSIRNSNDISSVYHARDPKLPVSQKEYDWGTVFYDRPNIRRDGSEIKVPKGLSIKDPSGQLVSGYNTISSGQSNKPLSDNIASAFEFFKTARGKRSLSHYQTGENEILVRWVEAAKIDIGDLVKNKRGSLTITDAIIDHLKSSS